MQAALSFTPSPISVVTPNKTLPLPCKSMPSIVPTSRCFPLIRAIPAVQDNSTVDYSSMSSVFPAEACETVGGEACDVEMYPEVKLKPEESQSSKSTASEQVDREYMDYNSPKTVFLEEACDDLGGEFCEPGYQTGVN